MSVASEISRINTNIANAYTALATKGATMPSVLNTANLASTINALEMAGGEAMSIETIWAICGYDPNALPNGYTMLEYIQSSGTQYVDTGFKPTGASKIVFDFQMVNQSTTQQALFGSRPGTTGRFTVFTGTSTGALQAEYNTQSSLSKSTAAIDGLDTNNRNTIELSNSLVVNGAVINTIDAVSFTSAYNLWLFANNAESAHLPGSTKLYSCKIYDNGTLVRDFVPCINPSGEVGLYDKVGKQFYGNAGTGVFAAGHIIPDGYTQLSFIESNGTQHIDTEFKPKWNTRVVVDVQMATYSATRILFGCRNANSTTASQAFLVAQTGASALRSDYFGSSNTLTIDGSTDQRLTIDKNANVLTVNGKSVSNTAVSSGESAYNLLLFTYNNSGNVGTKVTMKLYSCQISDGGVLVRDLVPCKRNSDGEIGLYDKVNAQFYGNAGSGSFTGV